MIYSVLGLVSLFLSVLAFGAVLRDAFQRSLGAGFMVLCIPGYNIYYAFSRFEHRLRGPIISLWLGGFGLGVALYRIAPLIN